MSYSKIGNVLSKIYNKTIDGSIIWEETAIEDSYQLSFPKYSIRIIRSSFIENEGIEFTLQIVNDEGQIIEAVNNMDLENILSGSTSMMNEIHDIARRQVLGVEQALDSILSDLKDDDLPF